MTTLFTIIVYIVIAILIIAGLILTLFNLPGIWVILIGILISAALNSFEVVTATHLIIFTIIAIFASVIDNLMIPIGAKKMGASKWGMLGAFLGAILGAIFAGPIGLVVGPFLGALSLEILMAKKEINEAAKAGFGSMIGFIAAVVIKFGAAVGITVAWLSIIL